MLKTLKNNAKIAYSALKLKSLEDQHYDQKVQQEILNLLSTERGLSLKIAQMINSDLQQNITEGKVNFYLEQSDIETILENELGAFYQELTLDFEDYKVASLSQVHFAKDHEGVEYALKIQYPDIRNKIQSQLKTLGLIGHLGAKTKLRKWGFDISSYLKEFHEVLLGEIDYKKEIESLETFSRLFPSRCPKVYREFSTEKVIVLERIRGESFFEIQQKGKIHLNEFYSLQILKTFFEGLLVHGFIQGDNQPGNFIFADSKVCFIDFGNMIQLTTKERLAFVHLFNEIINDGTNYSSALIALGFDKEKLSHLGKKINLLVDTIFDPLRSNFPVNFKTWNMSQEVSDILGEDKWWFRASGSSRSFQMVRSFIGLFSLIQKFGVMIPIRKLVSQVLSEVEWVILEPICFDQFVLPSKATHLNVVVTKQGKESVNLKMPARVIFELEDMIDEDVLAKLQENDYDIDEIKNMAIAEGLSPQVLFELEEKDKHYLVRLI
jgi:hypothetical protein